ncbi:MAG TPA: hypothetical protein VD771_01505 [Gemmatimonadaceae bacterium]|nr:hypothetical protein [Gemmatimonadaceae bacterium]
MAARLVRNGLQTQMQPILSGNCPACDNRTDFVIVSREYCICSECGTTSNLDKVDFGSPGIFGEEVLKPAG